MGAPDFPALPVVVQVAQDSWSWAKWVLGGVMTVAAGIVVEIVRRKIRKGE